MKAGIKAYLKNLEVKGYALGTIIYRENHLENWQTHLESQGITNLNQVNFDLLTNYIAALRNRKLKSTTIISHTNTLRQLFKFLQKKGFIKKNPALKLDIPRKETTIPQLPSQEEIAHILAIPDIRSPIGIRNRAILELLYSSGLRRQELINLNQNDIDLENGYIHVWQGKNSKDRVVPLGKTAAKFIEAYLKLARWWFERNPQETALFIESQQGKRLSAGTINNIIRKIVKKSQVAKKVSAHTFRHAMATHLLQNRADIRQIQMMLGHASVETTEIYTQLAIEDLKEVNHRAHPHGKQKK